MCLIAWAVGVSTRWPLVIAANRDEYWARPTEPLTRWLATSGQAIVSGRDLRAGGTWMGMTPAGRIAFLTNVREPGAVNPAWRSRGELVTCWLGAESLSAEALVSALQAEAHAQPGHGEFGGFNLVLGDVATGAWHWTSNRLDGAPAPPGHWPLHRLPPGVYGLSNAALNTPWPKTVRLTEALTAALTQSTTPSQLESALWAALADRQRCSPSEAPLTGVPPKVELALSSVCVDMPDMAYGTRSSTLLVATADASVTSSPLQWDVLVQERTHPADGMHPTSASPTAPTLHQHAMRWQAA